MSVRRWWQHCLFIAVWLGGASGGVEVALRADPRLGMDGATVMCWWGAGVGLNIALALAVAAMGARRWERPVGLVAAVLVAVHGGMYWRFDHAVNRFLVDPVVWGGALGVVLLSVGLGWCIQRSEALARGLMRMAQVAAVVSPLVVFAVNHGPTVDTAAAGPNVVVITLDTTRADRIGAYGSTNPTPHIDALAREGVVFEQVVSPSPLTEPAHLALFTGAPPHVTGVVANGTHIGDRPALLYRQLHDAGYATAGFVAAFPVHARFGWSQGMDVYDDDFGQVHGLHRLNLVKAWDQLVLRQHVLRERRGDRVVDRAIGWLRRERSVPFFLWLHLFDPHGPYEAPDHPFDPPVTGAPLDLPAYWPSHHRAIVDSDWLEAAYAAEIRFADVQVGRLVRTLREMGALDDTVVVLTADHGESLTENGLLFDHGDDLFEPSLRVPLIVRYPPAAKAGHRVACLASNMDVAPTVLSLLGRSGASAVHGQDRTGDLLGAPCRDAAVVATTVVGRFMDPPPIATALRWPQVKAIRGADGVAHCYGVGESVSDEAPLDACPARMEAALDASLNTGLPPLEPQLDPVTQSALRALGYVE